MTGKFLSVVSLVLAACAANAAAQEAAQDYPARPVKIVVPFGAGTVPDVLSRLVGQRLSEIFSQPFVVENRGGGGIPGVMTVVKAAPDGYTLLATDASVTAIFPFIFPNLPYDTLRDLVPITNIANSVQFLAASPSTGIGSFAELVSYAKANPGRLNYGSAGMGSVHHIAMEWIKVALGIDMVHVPYKGSGQSVSAFLAGEVQVVLAALPALGSHVKAGKAKLLAVTSAGPSVWAPDVPPVAAFIPGFDFSTGIGLSAPAGTPDAIVYKISGEVAKAMKRPEIVARLSSLAMEPVGSTPEAYVALIRSDLKRYSAALKISGAKVN